RRRTSDPPGDGRDCANRGAHRRQIRHARTAMEKSNGGSAVNRTMQTASYSRVRSNPYLDGAKVGLIVPSVNTTTEPEFAWIAPPRISFHAARVFMNVTTPEALRAMNREMRRAAELLATLSPDVVAYACTAGSFVDGPDAMRASSSRSMRSYVVRSWRRQQP